MSRIGNKSIQLPEKVTVAVSDSGAVKVEGPKGALEWQLPEGITVEQEEGVLSVQRQSEERYFKAMHGTTRSLLSNLIAGVSAGFSKELEIHGVGFRAAVKGKQLDLILGYSHPTIMDIPEGLTVTVSENTKIKVEGIDKQLVGQFAADVRAFYPPEPYKGKGVRYSDEHVQRKQGKAVK
ncbi:MAG: 50S ribosomal protein L6 [Verrucomicrobiota bacterium]